MSKVQFAFKKVDRTVNDIINRYITPISVGFIALCFYSSYILLKQVGIFDNMVFTIAFGAVFCFGMWSGLFVVIIAFDIERRFKKFKSVEKKKII